jgi:tRNA(His) guanylyltransferase
MAGSKYEYVRAFEQPDALLPSTFIVIRVDGHAFTKFTAEHGWAKPTDARGACLMTAAALDVLREWGDVVCAYGQSDEYSFLLPPRAGVFGRRAAKLATGVASLFAAAFVLHWPRYFPSVPLQRAPAFDGRCVCYPRAAHAADYLRWRQVDTHINALYNECFWALVQRGGSTPAQAHERLKGTLSDVKHELLHGTFGVNFAALPAVFKRGTTLLRVARARGGGSGGSGSGSGGGGGDSAAQEAGAAGGSGGGGGGSGSSGSGGGSEAAQPLPAPAPSPAGKESTRMDPGSSLAALPLPEGHPPLPPFSMPPNVQLLHTDYLAAPNKGFLEGILQPLEA